MASVAELKKTVKGLVMPIPAVFDGKERTGFADDGKIDRLVFGLRRPWIFHPRIARTGPGDHDRTTQGDRRDRGEAR